MTNDVEWTDEYLAHNDKHPLSIASREALKEYRRLRWACSKMNDEVSQTLGKALGYPWFMDDQETFPGATSSDGVCVGDHVAESLAEEAAKVIKGLRQELHETRADYEAELGREAQLRKEQNTKLYGSYLSAMQALQGMTNAFGAIGIGRPDYDAALMAAYAEIKRYLKHHAPKEKVLFECTCGASLVDKYDFLVKNIDKTMTLHFLDRVPVKGCITSIGTKYVRMWTDAGVVVVDWRPLVRVTGDV